MTAIAYYNEHDPEAAAWLRELIRRDLIAPGDVDERDIRDVIPTELARYRQCHFFAGVGVWSYAFRQAGWPDDRPVWTGSCPCQPFSEAGEREGFADERHLWPSWFHLISQCKPSVIFGEQVASTDAKPWLDLVQDDLEALGYAVGPIVLPAAGFGAPHPRHRIYFVADASSFRHERNLLVGGISCETQREGRLQQSSGDCPSGIVGNASRAGPAGRTSERRDDGSELTSVERTSGGLPGVVEQPQSERRQRRQGAKEGHHGNGQTPGRLESNDGSIGISETGLVEPHRPGPVNGFWRDADWLRCTDGLWRSARPGSFPLVDGTSSRVVRSGDPGEAVDAGTAEARAMRLRGYGNAICVEAAKAFVTAYLSSGE